MNSSDQQIAAALSAEQETLTQECRRDPVRLDRFLADDFHEFGRSGGELTKAGTAARVADEASGREQPIEVENLHGYLVADGIVMVKYTSRVGERRTHRTSLWRHDDKRGWQICHHQGTPTT